jgi:hypothetical protein
MRIFSRGVDPELRLHLAVMTGMFMCTAVLALDPQWLLHADYRCQLHMLSGIRCPFCGMTRDFVAMLHGSPPAQNPCSLFAAIFVYGLYPVAVFAAWRAGRLEWFHSAAVRCGVVVVLSIMLVANNWH